MKIAVLSDIHANHIALDKVLSDCRRFGVECLLILGDIIGYYYWPDLVIDLLSAFPSVEMIQGNHERMLQDILCNPERMNDITQKYGKGLEIAAKKLTASQQRNLTSQPSARQLCLDGCRFFLCHGSPFDSDLYVYPDADRSLLVSCAVPGFDFVLMGHTHYSFCFHAKGTTVANPGSVGQPRDIGYLASYLTVDTQNKSIIFRRVPFDTKPIIEAVTKEDLNHPYLKEVLMRKSQLKEDTYGTV
jgi:putative phosphoesterase